MYILDLKNILTAIEFLERRRENEASGVYYNIYEDCALSGNTTKNSSAKSIAIKKYKF
jgi:hypothetical protein